MNSWESKLACSQIDRTDSSSFGRQFCCCADHFFSPYLFIDFKIKPFFEALLQVFAPQKVYLLLFYFSNTKRNSNFRIISWNDSISSTRQLIQLDFPMMVALYWKRHTISSKCFFLCFKMNELPFTGFPDESLIINEKSSTFYLIYTDRLVVR